MWKDLTAQQKSDLMDIFLGYGITSLDEMRSFYDGRELSSGEGSNKYDGTSGNHSQQMNAQPNVFQRPDGSYYYRESPSSEEINLTPLNTAFDSPSQWTYTDAEGKVYNPTNMPVADSGTISQRDEHSLYDYITPSWWDDMMNYSNAHYNDTFLGAPARWRESWNNGTNPVKGLWDSAFGWTNPYTIAAHAADHLMGDNGIMKTINLYNNSDGSYADKWRWQASALGDMFELSMAAPAGKLVYNTGKDAIKSASEYGNRIRNVYRNIGEDSPIVAAALDDGLNMTDNFNWRQIYKNFRNIDDVNRARQIKSAGTAEPVDDTVRRLTEQGIYKNNNVKYKDFNDVFKVDADKRFAMFEPGKFIDYDLQKLSVDDVVKIFGPEARNYKIQYDIAAAHNFEGKFKEIGENAKFNILNRFAISKNDPDVAAGIADAAGIYSIPEYRTRFEKWGGLGDTFVENALNRLKNLQVQGRGKAIKIIGQHGVEGGAYTTPDPLYPIIGMRNMTSSKNIREFVRHEANHAAHGTRYQPEWMRVHNEKIKPVLREGKTSEGNLQKYYDEMDEIVERSKTAVEYANKIRKEGESLDSVLERVADMAEADIYNGNIPADIRQLISRFTKASTLNFWKNFVGGAVPVTFASYLYGSSDNSDNFKAYGGNLFSDDYIQWMNPYRRRKP